MVGLPETLESDKGMSALTTPPESGGRKEFAKQAEVNRAVNGKMNGGAMEASHNTDRNGNENPTSKDPDSEVSKSNGSNSDSKGKADREKKIERASKTQSPREDRLRNDEIGTGNAPI